MTPASEARPLPDREREKRLLRRWLGALLLIFVTAGISSGVLLGARKVNPVSAKVCVTFGRECEPLLIECIKQANKTIDIAIFSFARKCISDALLKAAGRGVKVRMKIDAEQATFEYTTELLKMMQSGGVKIEKITMPEGKHMHHKFAVIDKTTVITGSFNWTRQASQENWENMVTIESKSAAAQFREEWTRVKNHKE